MKRRVIEEAVKVVDRIAAPCHVVALGVALLLLATRRTLGAGGAVKRASGILMMGGESDSRLVFLELRHARRPLFDQVLRVRNAILAKCNIIGDRLETTGFTETVELAQPWRRWA
jgi:hypothetical protein